MAQVRRPTCTWSPKLEVDCVPIAYDATLRHYHGGHAGLVAEALEQPLLLPKDIEAYRNFNHLEIFLPLKRDLAMVSNCIRCSSFIHLHFLTLYSKSEILLVAEEWVKNARGETKVALDARVEVEAELGALKVKQAKMAE